MVDPIQKSSTIPVTNAQGLVTSRDPSLFGTSADIKRAQSSKDEITDGFENYLNKSQILVEEKAKKQADYDPAADFLAGSPYAAGSKYPA